MDYQRDIKRLAFMLALLFVGYGASAQTARVYHLAGGSGSVLASASSQTRLLSAIGQAQSGRLHRYVLRGSNLHPAAGPSLLASVKEEGVAAAMVAEADDAEQRTEAAGAEAFEAEAVPRVFALRPNYPNPFNPVTVIEFDLPEARVVELAVFDVLGRRVAVLVDGALEAGRHAVTWQAQHRPSGLYLYRIQAGDFVQIRQMMLVK